MKGLSPKTPAIAVNVLLSGCDQPNGPFAEIRLPIIITARASVDNSHFEVAAPISHPIPSILAAENVLAPYLDIGSSMNSRYPDVDYGDTMAFTISHRDEAFSDSITLPGQISEAWCDGTPLTNFISSGGSPDVFQPKES